MNTEDEEAPDYISDPKKSGRLTTVMVWGIWSYAAYMIGLLIYRHCAAQGWI